LAPAFALSTSEASNGAVLDFEARAALLLAADGMGGLS
jgi:hypothetical protein